MPYHAKGFSLIELLVTVSLVAIVAAIAMPSFTSSIQSNRADTEVSDLQRALNYARLEAINRGITLRVAPVSGTDWATDLRVSASGTALRDLPALSSGATLTNGSVAALEFNNLGGLITPSTTVTFTYTLGSISKNLLVCVTGRIVLSPGTC